MIGFGRPSSSSNPTDRTTSKLVPRAESEEARGEENFKVGAADIRAGRRRRAAPRNWGGVGAARTRPDFGIEIPCLNCASELSASLRSR